MLKNFVFFILFNKCYFSHEPQIPQIRYYVRGELLFRDVNVTDTIYRSHRNAPYLYEIECSKLFENMNTTGIKILNMKRNNVCVGKGGGFEKNYLLALNPSVRNLSTEEINQFATDSLINENVKRIEIEKRYEILQNKKMINKVIKDIY